MNRKQFAVMVFESSHLRVTANHGTATLWLQFPGEPVNALDLARLRELDTAIQAIAARHAIRVLVIRSGLPGGFCAGLSPSALASLKHPAERAAFAWYGQQVFDRLAQLDAVTVAFLDGLCLGAGLELALACDYRVCVARPTTHLGFPERFTCFGGSARLRQLIHRRAMDVVNSGRTLSGREARTLGFVDVACCERRSRIELRTLLDRIEAKPVKPRSPIMLTGLATERQAFAERILQVSEAQQPSQTLNPVPPFPAVVGLLGDDDNAARIVADAVLRGCTAVVSGNQSPVMMDIDLALARGFITPLEADQARSRVHVSDTRSGFEQAGLVFVSPESGSSRLAEVVASRAIVCVNSQHHLNFPFPRRVVRVDFPEPRRVALFPDEFTAPDTLATLAAWLKPFGFTAVEYPTKSHSLPRAA